MEQKKLLLVLFSVGIFLVIAFGAAILLFKPNQKPAVGPIASGPAVRAPAPNSAPAPASADPSEWVRNPQAVPGLQPPPSGSGNSRGDVIIIYGERPNTSITKPDLPASTTQVTADGGLKVDVTVPQTQQSAIPPIPEPPVPAATDDSGPSIAKAAPSAKNEKAPAAKNASTAKKTTTATKTEVKRGDEFWIQTGSFSAKARADAAKETLGTKGIASLVETKDVAGKTYFRVRVGPYSSKNEADYWLSLVKTIDGFDGSYVSLIKAKR